MGCRVAKVHLEWNLIFFVEAVGLETAVIAYNMDSRKVHVTPTHYVQYGTRDILPAMNSRAINLLYVPLLLKLESLAKE
jgi:hypothetical protein